MRTIKSIFDFYIDSSIHVALSVVALSWISLLEFDLKFDKYILLFVFFASITGYNFVKYFGLAKFHHRSLSSWLRITQIFSLFCFISLCYFLIKLQEDTIFYIGIFSIVTFLYAIPILPRAIFLDKQKNLRSISGLKVYIIALVWSGVTVILPLANQNYDITDDVILTFAQRFLFVLVLMLPFEIRDLNYDSLKLATIPQKIGVRQTKILGLILLFVFYFLEFFKDEVNLNYLLGSSVILVVTLLFLVFSKKKQDKYYSAFWVEGLPVIWLGILLLIG
ncbi:membrane protein [Psychroserpens sp. Hel_I_66]|uniref:membrane protein n=1 Tax=Psychroserpens sp. Hel_I_66 TaxID=1250004 RepID=UPI0006461CD8|nr:membrane protein [Psychroserpens sp. Hel_I_66]